jgi:hypothetical protein
MFEGGRSRIQLIPLAVVLPPLIGLTLLMRSGRFAAALDAAPPSWLVGIQVYRILGGYFLVLWAYGGLPGEFALPAGIGDVFVGLLALPTAFYLAARARRLGVRSPWCEIFLASPICSRQSRWGCSHRPVPSSISRRIAPTC